MKNPSCKSILKFALLFMVSIFLFGQPKLNAQETEHQSKTMSILVKNKSYFGEPYQEMIISEAGKDLKTVYIIDKDLPVRLKRKKFKSRKDIVVREKDLKSTSDLTLVLLEIDLLKEQGWRLVSSNHAIGIGMSENSERSEMITYFILER